MIKHSLQYPWKKKFDDCSHVKKYNKPTMLFPLITKLKQLNHSESHSRGSSLASEIQPKCLCELMVMRKSRH